MGLQRVGHDWVTKLISFRINWFDLLHVKGLLRSFSSTTTQKHQFFGAWVSSVQSFSHVPLFVAPWTVACRASGSITKSQSLLRLVSIESVIPYNHLILCLPFLLPPSIFSNIRVFSKELVLHSKWPTDWSFSNHQSFQRIFQEQFLLGLTGWISLLARDSQESSLTPQF